MKNLKKNKKIETIKKVVNILLVILVLLFVLIVCMQRFSNNRLSFFNYRMFTVVTGSMEPRYKVGDVLIAKERDPEKVKVGDTISYLGEVGQFKDKVITHEVIEIEKNEKGEILFHTKGLSNIIEDPIVHERQLYGVVTGKLFILSLVYKIVGTKIGMFLFVIVPVLYIVGSEIVNAMLEKEEERRKKLKNKEKEE